MMDIGAIVKSIKKPLPFYSGYSGPVRVDDKLIEETYAKLTHFMVACVGFPRIYHVYVGGIR